MTEEWGLVQAIDAVTAAVPDREMIVWGDVRRTFAEVDERSTRLGAFLADRGLGVHRERDDLERWECGQSPVALVMGNRAEYLEAMFGCFRARAVPFNVNQQYRPGEIRGIFDMIGTEAVIYERRYGDLLRAVFDEVALGGADLVLVDIDDGSDADRLPGAVDYEDAIADGGPALATPSPDDLVMVCTGGTTGAPKAVLWRQADIRVAAMAGAEDPDAEAVAEVASANAAGRWFAAPPLMHAAAQWTAFCGLHSGATVVLHDDSGRFDAAAILDIIEAERATLISIVGDAYAGPMIDEQRRSPRDLSSLTTIGVGGAVTSEVHKQSLLELIPDAMIMDGYGASETGGMAFGASTRDTTARSFSPGAGAVVLSEDRTRVLDAGDADLGWIARRGRVPLGYLGNQDATEATFPVVDGVRFAVPGDRGQVLDDGSIVLHGRDAMVVNTGGEKVFVEEVEEALRSHPAVADALVVGRSSERFGQEVVGLVELRDGRSATPQELREHCTVDLARFKAPRAIAFVDRVGRHASGKPDYRWAKDAAVAATPASGPVGRRG